jgi:hypothetical protein
VLPDHAKNHTAKISKISNKKRKNEECLNTGHTMVIQWKYNGNTKVILW